MSSGFALHEVILDERGKPLDYRFLDVNPAFEKLTGWKAADLIGRAVLDVLPDTEIFWTETYGRVAATGEQFCFENYSKKLDKYLEVTVYEPEPGRYASIFQDITDRKRAEEENRTLAERLQHADKMEAIGTLAGGIAHDFNNLLMGILGYTSLSLMNLDPSHPNYERLKRIEEQVQSGADLTRQLLGFARGVRYEVKPADMNDILEKSSSMFERTRKEISIQRKYGKDLRTVEVDRGQMEQVFMNLYVNAWQAMPGGGKLYLETEDVLLNDEQAVSYSVRSGEYVKISVTDTGMGMDEKTRERIFEPFFTTKEMGRGTGLGLATVYGIIKGHKGTINVYSEPGHGTTFTIYLPVSDKEVVRETMETETIARGMETILLVDDEKMVLEVNKELLESMGYLVYGVGSGQEAIAVYREKEKEIDLVILDMIMPGMSGGETFDRLREINPEIKVLLSSGYSITGKAQAIMDRGCNGFLQKPFQIEKFSRKVREMLG
jgi:PAS domain S-box-containing protein